MKSMIIYYSYSGNTRKVAHVLSEYLSQKGSVDLVELKALDESGVFLKQCQRALQRVRARIEEINLDCGNYDLVCFGTPVWAFGPAPAMNTCLDKCAALEGKEIILFTTFGSGTGNERCLKYMQGLLEKKGAKIIKWFSLPQRKVKNKEYVLEEIKRLWPNG